MWREIVYSALLILRFRTEPAVNALAELHKEFGDKKLARVKVAVESGNVHKLKMSPLVATAAQAHMLDQLGYDRREGTVLLFALLRMVLEMAMSKISNQLNMVVSLVATVALFGSLSAVMLAMLGGDPSAMIYSFAMLPAMILFVRELVPPITTYRALPWVAIPPLGALAGYLLAGVKGAFLGYAAGAVPVFVAWYLQYRPAVWEINSFETMLQLVREGGGGWGASTLGRLTMKVFDIVQESGAFDLEQHAVNVMSLLVSFLRAVRTDALTRGLVMLALYFMGAYATLYTAHMMSTFAPETPEIPQAPGAPEIPQPKIAVDIETLKLLMAFLGIMIGFLAGAVIDSPLLGVAASGVGPLVLLVPI